MSKTYTPLEVAIRVLQKSEELLKAAMPGLKTAKLTPVEGVISPTNANTASPMKVGSQATVKTAKAKKPGQATDKPSVFFKSEPDISSGVDKLRIFLSNRKNKNEKLSYRDIEKIKLNKNNKLVNNIR